MKQHTATLALSMLALAWGREGATQPTPVGVTVTGAPSTPIIAPARRNRPVLQVPTTLTGVPTPTPAPTPACTPVRTVRLSPGRASLTAAPLGGAPCAAPFAAGTAPTSNEVLLLEVPSRMAVSLSTTQGRVQLFARDGAGAVRAESTDGLCAAGTSTVATILDAGTWALRTVGDAPAGPRVVHVEAVTVPAWARPVVSGGGIVPMSTATSAAGPFDCNVGDGVDLRVLACPRARASVASFSAPLGVVASLESLSTPRTCYAAAPQASADAALPAGDLVIVRVWPRGNERGAASVTLR